MAVWPPVTRPSLEGLHNSLVVVRDAHRLCYAPTRCVGAMIVLVEQNAYYARDILASYFADAFGAAPRSVRGLGRDTPGR